MLADCDLVAFLSTTDLDRARVFFAETVGLVLSEDTPFGCVFDAHGTSLRVTLVDEVRPAPYTVLGWVVSDLAAELRGLVERGAVAEDFADMDQDVQGIWTTPDGGLVAWFKDPDDNLLSLTQFAPLE